MENLITFCIGLAVMSFVGIFALVVAAYLRSHERFIQMMTGDLD